MPGRARRKEYIQQFVASEAIIAASSKKKDVTTVIRQGLDIVTPLYKSDNEHIKVWVLVGPCKLAKACRRFLINPGRDSNQRRGSAERLSCLTLDADGEKKLVRNEPAMRTLIELGKSGGRNMRNRAMAILSNLPNSYDKQGIHPKMFDLAKSSKHHNPEEHELDNKNFADKQVCTISQLNVGPALAAQSKTESLNTREPIARVMNDSCKHPQWRG